MCVCVRATVRARHNIANRSPASHTRPAANRGVSRHYSHTRAHSIPFWSHGPRWRRAKRVHADMGACQKGGEEGVLGAFPARTTYSASPSRPLEGGQVWPEAGNCKIEHKRERLIAAKRSGPTEEMELLSGSQSSCSCFFRFSSRAAAAAANGTRTCTHSSVRLTCFCARVSMAHTGVPT